MPDVPNHETGPWTFDSLAGADRETLERVLLAGERPDFGRLEGRVYCGWNEGPLGGVAGRKFKKGFRRRDGERLGYNELCRRDRDGHTGSWEVKLAGGKPRQVGFFRVGAAAGAAPGRIYERYGELGLFDYGIGLNRWGNLPFRLIRDFVSLPNPGDHDLLLGKAYLRLGRRGPNLHWCYFVLGHPGRLEHEPW